ncbi:peptide deformylase [Candidatus Wolfebacteria bacterium CG10_big_fil_rev_8_21_14_0_10_31_9]|uniref:Peptide deformylase n=1 Tax=Candidatus Wolfebacteria bacterium CG10_big_fil_rev_8_21_14_0_10_31_9 TaxID=1975070 RepID=A0A2H0RCF2_9BACT|nr:MAG: peptide deformylase [Candidatus Wolfebacteria bacterium CG10_big_fil_rev_8_21_14_0_10_31_9]
MNYKILTINNKIEEKFLRKKTADFDFSKFTKKELKDLLKIMRKIMRESIGIGLSANQIGLNLRFFVAQISTTPIKRDENNKIILPPDSSMKFYAIFNPEIVKFSDDKIIIEEGCLSVPGYYGEVERPEKIVLEYYNRYGKKIKIKADGLLARVFQHEVDHLNGVLFIDKIKKARAK